MQTFLLEKINVYKTAIFLNTTLWEIGTFYHTPCIFFFLLEQIVLGICICTYFETNIFLRGFSCKKITLQFHKVNEILKKFYIVSCY